MLWRPAAVPPKVKHNRRVTIHGNVSMWRLGLRPAPPLDMCPKELKTGTRTNTRTSAFFTRAKRNRPDVHRRVGGGAKGGVSVRWHSSRPQKEGHFHTRHNMGGPEDVMLSEIRTSRKKPNLARCHSHEVRRADEVAETESRTSFQGLAEGRTGRLMGTEFPFGKTGKVLEMDGSDGRGTTLNALHGTDLYA